MCQIITPLTSPPYLFPGVVLCGLLRREHLKSLHKPGHSYEVLHLIMGLVKVKCKCGAENIEFFEIGVVLALIIVHSMVVKHRWRIERGADRGLIRAFFRSECC